MTSVEFGIIMKKTVTTGKEKDMSQIPRPFEIYKHFKGNLYQVINIAEHSETGEKLVIYQALYGEYKVYARPLESFVAVLDKEKYPNATQTYRFEVYLPEDRNVCESEATQGTACESKESLNAVLEEQAGQNEVIETEELHIDPMVMEFLDVGTYEEKLQILSQLQYRITDDMITTMAVACDVEVPEGKTEDRFLALRNCLITLGRFECNRLR